MRNQLIHLVEYGESHAECGKSVEKLEFGEFTVHREDVTCTRCRLAGLRLAGRGDDRPNEQDYLYAQY